MPSRACLAIALALPACTFEVTGFDATAAAERTSADAAGSSADRAATDLAMPDLGGIDLAGLDLAAPLDLALPPDLTAPLDLTVLPAELTVLRGNAANQNLTAEGLTDWAAWGYQQANAVNRKVTGGSQIGATPVLGIPIRYSPYPIAFTWTDGAPTLMATSSDGIYVNGRGGGFTVTAPADGLERVLRLYLCDYNGAGALTATLGDGSAGMMTGLGDGNACYQFRITYRASSTTLLTVTWILSQDLGAGAVSLLAATLQP